LFSPRSPTCGSTRPPNPRPPADWSSGRSPSSRRWGTRTTRRREWMGRYADIPKSRFKLLRSPLMQLLCPINSPVLYPSYCGTMVPEVVQSAFSTSDHFRPIFDPHSLRAHTKMECCIYLEIFLTVNTPPLSLSLPPRICVLKPRISFLQKIYNCSISTSDIHK